MTLKLIELRIFHLKIESGELKIVTKFESHNVYPCARCYRVSLAVGGGVGVAVCVGNRQQKGPLLQFYLCHMQTNSGGGGGAAFLVTCGDVGAAVF